MTGTNQVRGFVISGENYDKIVGVYGNASIGVCYNQNKNEVHTMSDGTPNFNHILFEPQRTIKDIAEEAKAPVGTVLQIGGNKFTLRAKSYIPAGTMVFIGDDNEVFAITNSSTDEE